MAEYRQILPTFGVIIAQIDTLEVSETLNQSKARVRIYHKNIEGLDWNSGYKQSDYRNGGYFYGLTATFSVNGVNSTWTFTGPQGTWNLFEYYKNNNPSGMLYDNEVIIQHGPDGRKTFNVSVAFKNNTGSVVQNLGSFSINHTLNRISHNSTATITGNTIGLPVTIAIKRSTTGLTHKLYWTFGSLSGAISENATTSATWTPSLPQLSPQIPNSSSGKATIRLETYAGTEKTGERTYEHTLNLPSTVKPTFTGITLIDGNDKAKALNLGANTYVQTQSNIRPRFDGANGIYGSQIVSYRAEIQRWVNNQWQATTLSTTANNGLTGNANFTGRAKVVAYVTDSRGRQSDRREVEINYLPYHVPAISFKGERTGADDVKINVIRNLKIAPLTVGNMQKNTARLSFDVVDVQTNQRTNNIGGSANWTGATEHEKINWTATLDGTYDVGKTYLVIGKLSDAFHTSTFEYKVGVQAVPVSISKHGLAVGKEWTRGVLDVGNSNLPAYFDCDIIMHGMMVGHYGSKHTNDFNTTVVAGFYSFSGQPNGRPPQETGTIWGVLEVINSHRMDETNPTNSASWVYQICRTTTQKIYTRERINQGYWSSWKQLATTDLIGSQKHKLSEDNGTSVSASGDWNNYKSVGFYHGNNLANRPENLAGPFLVTVQKVNDSYLVQQAIHQDSDRSFMRRYYGNVWQPWKEYAVEKPASTWVSTGVAGVDYKVTGDVVSLRINIASMPSATASLGNIPIQYLPVKNAESRFQLAGAMLYISANGAISTRYGTSGLAVHTQVTWQI